MINHKMDSLFEMQRFDPTAEADDDKKESDDAQKLPSKLKEKLKRKLPPEEAPASAENVPDKEIEGESAPDTKSEEGKPEAKKKKRNKKKPETEEESSGFTILGDPTNVKLKKVNRVLPYWLSHPDIVTVDLHSSPLPVTDLPGLDKTLVDKLLEENIESFFPVQRQVIPHLLEFHPRFRPSDMCVSAPTGSGKTLAFVLPVVSALKNRVVPRVRCIAVLPTQELAQQVYSVFHTFTGNTGLKVKLLKGAGGESEAEETGLVRRGVGDMVHQLCDILVVTPGRLTHTIKQCPNLDLTHLRYLVIDEADRMMENIAQDWLNVLETAVYSGHRTRPGPLTAANAFKHCSPLQKLLFSATLSHDPEQLEQLNLFEPKLFRCVVPVDSINTTVSAQSLPTTLTQQYSTVTLYDKPLLVHHLLTSLNLSKVLIFTNSNETVHRLYLVLQNLGHKVGKINSGMWARKKVLSSLKSGATNVVVCSDVLARGIDVENLDAVISYDVPRHLTNYIHRAGRTARAGKPGRSITLCEEKQVKNFLNMLKKGNILDIEELNVPGEDLDKNRKLYTDSLEQVKAQLSEEMMKKKGKHKSNKK